jgi:hypothetical protein
MCNCHFCKICQDRSENVEKVAKMVEYTYSTVEQALAKTYNASDDEVRKSAFRARINGLQRLGVLGEKVKVGKGQKLTYTVDQMERWIACLELAELGISLTTTAKLVTSYWAKKLAPIFRAAQGTVIHDPSLDDVILYLGAVHLMSGSWSSESDFPGVPNVNHCTLRKLPIHMKAWMDDPARSRMLITNLSARLRQFHTALCDSYNTELRTERAGQKKR